MERKQYLDQFSVDVAINYQAKLAYKIVGWLGCGKSVLTQNTVTFTINKVKLFSKAAHRVLNLLCLYTKLRWELYNVTKKKSLSQGLLGYLANLVPRASLLPVNWLGTLRSDDGDGNGNATKAIGLISKTTILHVHHDFLHVSCRHCTTTTWKCLISRCTEEVQKRRRNFVSLSELGYGS